MSLVAEILNSASRIDAEFINKKVPELKKNVEVLMNEVSENVDNLSIKYSQRYIANDILHQKAKEMQHTLEDLKKKGEFIINKDLINVEKEVSSNMAAVQLIDFKMQVILKVQNILKFLNEFNENLSANQFTECVETLNNLRQLLEAIPSDEYLEVIDILQNKIEDSQLMFDKRLKDTFTNNIELIQFPEKSSTILRIKRPNEEMQNVMFAYCIDLQNIVPLQRLAKDLWNYVFVPIVNEEVVLTIKEDSTFVSIDLTLKSREKSNYKTVFGNLQEILTFLSQNFTYTLKDDLTALEYIGDDIRDNLSELIIKNCLRDTIPSDAEELENYNVVIQATKELEKTLLDARIFNDKTTSILEYASKVDVLFINKKCDEYLATAERIIKKDLHDIVEVGAPYDPNFPLGRKTMEFPQSSISKNVQELVKFIEDLLQKAVEATPECSGRFYITATNILSLYRTMVPAHHETYLATLPQQIAVFLNNCQYIMFKMIEWNEIYCKKMRPVLVSCDFSAEIELFSSVGFEIFNKFISSQVKQIQEIMAGAQLDGPTIETLDAKTEKSVRQCLRQQELLKTVWHKVLSYDIYNKNIGIIVNALCKCIIDDIIKFEDINAKVAEELVDVIKLVTTRAPKLFINPREIPLYVPLWYKLNELSFVLNANLAEINDRWASGKGPLALQFEVEELKHLIKALFQNTDRRAAVLAAISSVQVSAS